MVVAASRLFYCRKWDFFSFSRCTYIILFVDPTRNIGQKPSLLLWMEMPGAQTDHQLKIKKTHHCWTLQSTSLVMCTSDPSAQERMRSHCKNKVRVSQLCLLGIALPQAALNFVSNFPHRKKCEELKEEYECYGCPCKVQVATFTYKYSAP